MEAKIKKQFAEQKQPLLFIAPDRYRKQKFVSSAQSALRSAAVDVNRISCIDLSKSKIDELALSCLSLSLFGSGNKLFIITHASELKTDLMDQFLDFLTKAMQSHWIVVTSDKKHRSDRIQRWFKKDG